MRSLGGGGGSHRIPLSYLVLALFCAVTMTTFNYYWTFQFKPADVARTKSSINVGESTKDTPLQLLSGERWNQIKQMSCPKQVPNSTIWPTLFTQARIELGFDMDTIPNTPEDRRFVNGFFTFFAGSIGYTSLDGEHHFAYLRIWKSANDQIRRNIDLVVRKKDNLWEIYESGLDKPLSHIPLSKRSQTCLVTAVRDPVEHFLSAYNEIEQRSTDSYHESPQKHYERYENGTDARFERYVSEFIFGASSTKPTYIIKHAFSQTGVLWELEKLKALLGVNAPRLVAYLPNISNISATFPNLVATNCPGFEEEFGRPFSQQFDHKSQKDTKHNYAAAKRVWRKQGATSRALCALHLMDYACFDLIPVPNLCQDVFSDESFFDRLRNPTVPSTTPPTPKDDRVKVVNVRVMDPGMLVP